jgi:hypothetical protein
MTKLKPNGDLGGKGNLINQATPEGGGSKVTVDPQGNPVSIRNLVYRRMIIAFPSSPVIQIQLDAGVQSVLHHVTKCFPQAH